MLKKDINGRTPLEVAKTHADKYTDKAKRQEAYDLLSGKKQWQAQPRASQVPQRLYRAPQKSERDERQFSKFDKAVDSSWHPKRP